MLHSCGSLLLCFYKILKLKYLWYLRRGLFLDTIEVSTFQWVGEGQVKTFSLYLTKTSLVIENK